jgi:hypothetical protein
MKRKFVMASLSKKWFSQFVTIFSIVCVTYFILFFCCSMGQNIRIFILSNQIQLHEKIIYTTNFDFYLSDEEKKAEAEKIAHAEGVTDVENIQYYLVMPEDKLVSIGFIVYDTPTLRQLHYSLDGGSYPTNEKANCVLLPHVYMDTYQIGDVIPVTVAVGGDLQVEEKSQITVSGFLAAEPVLYVHVSGTAMGLNHIFPQGDDAYGVIYSLVDQQGNRIVPNRSEFFIISTEQGSDVDKVKAALNSVVESPAFLHTGKEVIAQYSEDHEMDLLLAAGFGLASLALAFSMLLANTLLSLVYRQREMSVYFMCGATWKESISTIISQQSITFAIGFVLGVWIFANSARSPLFYIAVPEMNWQYLLATFLAEIVMYACAVLPFYWMTLHKSPLELFRKD